MNLACAQRIRVTGLVQGVGYRPFVWHLAQTCGISGWVRNDASGVDIHAQGQTVALERFLAALRQESPPLARVEGVAAQTVSAEALVGFAIQESRAGELHTMIGADTAVCADCLAELCEPESRRWRHAFITCTHCGPRYTLTQRLPYDRPQTSMAKFPFCPACASEYRDPSQRRFHAETNCCPVCGPQLQFCDADAQRVAGDPIALAAAALRDGAILAIKGLGGFHLACDARNTQAVARLRERKSREAKPLALMSANLISLAPLVEIDADSAAALQSRERPILVMPRSENAELLAGVAPGLDALGVMLPCTPVQYLLFHEAAGRPVGVDWLNEAHDLLLVMTSANPGGEPLTINNHEAFARLGGIADAFVLHDRDILIRCDDSVLRATPQGHRFIRRARGYSPQPLTLPASGPSVLALGAWFKSTLCVTRDAQAWVSQHIGDLDSAPACQFLEESVEHLLALLDVRPALIAHDLHPDFHSTRLAQAMAAQLGVPTRAVQHHHAHIAAVAAEHAHTAPLLGLALDGVGLGSDGGAWGGELLALEGASFTRLSHLAPLALPGTDRAAREPWRMAAAALWQLGRGEEIASRFAQMPAASQLGMLLERRLNCPPTSSAGRLFDAAAGLLGVRTLSEYEGQAAMELEALASRGQSVGYEALWEVRATELDFSPLLARLADWKGRVEDGAALFHASLAGGLIDWVCAAADQTGIHSVALGGGCFLNNLLSQALANGLRQRGLRVLEPRQFPPNDGAISLGQAWVALRELWG